MEATAVSPAKRQNDLFEALANHRRRYTLYACDEAAGELSLSDVAEQVAAWEYGKSIEAVTSSERKRVYTSLQQHHLPRLVEAGLVEFDGGTVQLTEMAEDVDLYLDIVTKDTLPWSLYYLGLSIIGGFMLVVTHFFAMPDPITTSVIGAVIVVAFGVSAVIHHNDTRGKHLDSSEISAVGSDE